MEANRTMRDVSNAIQIELLLFLHSVVVAPSPRTSFTIVHKTPSPQESIVLAGFARCFGPCYDYNLTSGG